MFINVHKVLPLAPILNHVYEVNTPIQFS